MFRLPTSCFAEEDGALVNSARWLQWHWKGAEPPGEARSDLAIMGELFTRLRALYKKDGGAYPDPIVNLYWPYARPASPTPEELAKEYSGRALKDLDGSEEARHPDAQSRRAARGLCRAARGRQHSLGMLALLRRLGSER